MPRFLQLTHYFVFIVDNERYEASEHGIFLRKTLLFEG